MNNVLHVPNITKNLRSISQLTLDNNVTVEFSSRDCVLKDKNSRKAVLQGLLKNGLYQLSDFSPRQHFTSPTFRSKSTVSDCISKSTSVYNLESKFVLQVLVVLQIVNLCLLMLIFGINVLDIHQTKSLIMYSSLYKFCFMTIKFSFVLLVNMAKCISIITLHLLQKLLSLFS